MTRFVCRAKLENSYYRTDIFGNQPGHKHSVERPNTKRNLSGVTASLDGFKKLFDAVHFCNDFINQFVFTRFLGRHKAVTVRIVFNLIERLTSMFD